MHFRFENERICLTKLTGNGIGGWKVSLEKSMSSELAVRLKEMTRLILVNMIWNYGYSRLQKT